KRNSKPVFKVTRQFPRESYFKASIKDKREEKELITLLARVVVNALPPIYALLGGEIIPLQATQ
ncbi:MAG: hypothetical protein Q8R15_05050, partial [Candidatus Micrarchaeota archaeon]|nr:hypothetical protein [Candidatus Micrarchaeota archaeon]